MQTLARLISLLILTIAVTNCATFNYNRLPEIKSDELEFKAEKKTKIFSRWSADFDSTFNKERLGDIYYSAQKASFEKIAKDTNCCTIVDSTDEADLVLQFKTYGESKSSAIFFAVLTGATFYVIPSWVTNDVHIEVKAQNKSANKGYDFADSAVFVQWLPLLLVAPFQERGPFEGATYVEENVFRNLIKRLKDDGFLRVKENRDSPAAQPAPGT